MKHEYCIRGRRGSLIPVGEDAIKSLIFAGEIEFDSTGHVGKDTTMTHYFKFKVIENAG